MRLRPRINSLEKLSKATSRALSVLSALANTDSPNGEPIARLFDDAGEKYANIGISVP